MKIDIPHGPILEVFLFIVYINSLLGIKVVGAMKSYAAGNILLFELGVRQNVWKSNNKKLV